MLKEWPLVAFTVLSQAAAGLYLFLGTSVYFLRADSWSPPIAARRPVFLLVVLSLLAVSTALSLFHLRRPARAYQTLINLRRSWLSREILSLAFFGGAAAALTVCEWRGIGGPGSLRTTFVLGGLGGFFLLATMSRLYMLPAVATWNCAYTPLSFFSTAAGLGAVAAAFMLSVSPARLATMRPVPPLLLVMALGGVASSLLNAALLAPVYGVLGGRPRPSLRQPGARRAFLHGARLFFLAAGGAILAVVLITGGDRNLSAPGRAPAMLLAVLVLAGAGEVCGRLLFYSQSSRRN